MGKFKIEDDEPVIRTEGGVNQEYNVRDYVFKGKANKYFNLQYIPLDNIVPNPLNEKWMKQTTEEDILVLAEAISSLGMKQNLEVKILDNGKYMLIAGEKRWRALNLLKERGNDVFPEGVPCLVEPVDLDPVDEKILIDATNVVSRNPSSEELIPIVIDFESNLREKAKKDKSKIKNIDKLIVSLLKHKELTERKVRRFRHIYSNLIPELYQLFLEGKITQRDCEDYCSLNEAEQKLVYTKLNDGLKLSKDDVRAIVEQLEEVTESSLDDSVIITVDNVIENDPVPEMIVSSDKRVSQKPPIIQNDDTEKKDAPEAVTKVPDISNIANDVIESAPVKKKIKERELSNLSNKLAKFFKTYLDLEREYRNEYGTNSPVFETVHKLFDEIAQVGGDN